MGQQQLFTINGLVDTNKTVWQNLEELAGASAAYVTWDPYTFKYGVVINQPGNSIRSFTDNNIIGSVSITETPFDELYNSAEIRFPNKDIRDKTDTIRYDQPSAERFDLEPDNKLSIQFDFVNDPIQADVIARTELKQSRVSKTVAFTTDFQQLDMAPGDIIDLTNPYWGWDTKLFRIVEITQTDTVQGDIFVDIVAVEYDADVYNYNDLTRLERTVNTGVPSVKNNTAVQTKSDETLGTQVGRAVGTAPGRTAITSSGIPVFGSTVIGLSDVEVLGLNSGDVATSSVEFTETSKMLMMVVEQPQGDITYGVYIDEVLESRVYTGNLPVIVSIQYSTDNATWSEIAIRILDSQTGSTTFALLNQPAGFYRCEFTKVDTLDLDQDTPAGFVGQKGTVSVTSIATPFININGDAASLSIVQFAN
tara:strand:- start:6824 stop:8089 length:1266 start_codon:yes stop_codon:yes gene_type:complete